MNINYLTSVGALLLFMAGASVVGAGWDKAAPERDEQRVLEAALYTHEFNVELKEVSLRPGYRAAIWNEFARN